jgi:hypothetical protein
MVDGVVDGEGENGDDETNVDKNRVARTRD